MSKRKAGVNDIIYELDNDDIEISSEDEAKEAKIQRTNAELGKNIAENIIQKKGADLEPNEIDKSPQSASTHNGGKMSPNGISDNNNVDLNNDSTRAQETETDVNNGKKLSNDVNKTTIFNEDIVVDSPATNSDLGVVGCENRTPLVTVRFRDKKLASSYKRQLKTFMLSLIKLHEEDSADLESETDIELDIWPEDLNEDYKSDFENENDTIEQDSLFFVDTAPCSNTFEEVPAYTQVSTLISNKTDKEPSPPPRLRRTPLCFNCDGPHALRDCRLPRDNSRIAGNRKNMPTRAGRYHVEDEQKYGHLIAGRISGTLRNALGLKRHELPVHIYRMRMLGYPPGWLEEARISHSGITMFDSTGAAIHDSEEEGEVCEPGSKDKFDIKKILDFPGFNVPASSRYIEEAHFLGMPPPSDQDSKIAMLQILAPNAMKAYKRKKLMLFPSAASNNTSAQEIAEMELDSGDEAAEFPSVPPLPDEAPPPPPQAPPPPPGTPPPAPPLPPPASSPPPCPSDSSPPPYPSASPPPLPPGVEEATAPTREIVESADEKSADDLEVLEVIMMKDIPVPKTSADEKSADDLEVVEVIMMKDIPVPETEMTIDDDEVKSLLSSGRDSPSLDDLEEKKRALLNALEGELTTGNISIVETKLIADDDVDVESAEMITEDSISQSSNNIDEEKIDSPKVETTDQEIPAIAETSTNDQLTSVDDKIDNKPNVSTPESKTGHVKTTKYGTPVINIASPYVKLPSDDKFAKDICDVINFENLPNSTGKYKQICNLLKKVKSEVDRIQDS